jgi:hypothetical protein
MALPQRSSKYNKSQLAIDNEQKDNINAENVTKTQCRAAGILAAQTLIALGVTVGGEEFKPITDEKTGTNEQDNLTMAFANYFEVKGITDIPAGVALSIAVAGYIVPRFTMPKTQSRFKTFIESIVIKYAVWNNKRAHR